MNSVMFELRDDIKRGMELLRALKQTTPVDEKRVDEVSWELLGNMLDLQSEVKLGLDRAGDVETVTEEEEIAKRQTIANIANFFQGAMPTFNELDENELDLKDLLEEMSTEATWESLFVQSDLDEVVRNKERVEEYVALEEEKATLEAEKEAALDAAISFKDYNDGLNLEFEDLIKDENLDGVNIEEANAELKRQKAKQSRIKKDIKVLEAANVDMSESFTASSLREVNAKLLIAEGEVFKYKLTELLRSEVTSYDELQAKMDKINKLVNKHRLEEDRVYKGENVDVMDRKSTMYTMYIGSIVAQLEPVAAYSKNTNNRVAEIDARLAEIDSTQKELYGNIKTIEEVKEDLNPLKRVEDILNDVDDLDMNPEIVETTPILDPSITDEITKGQTPEAKPISTVTEEVDNSLDNENDLNNEPEKNRTYKVGRVAPAKPSLTKKVKTFLKNVWKKHKKWVVVGVIAVATLVGANSLADNAETPVETAPTIEDEMHDMKVAYPEAPMPEFTLPEDYVEEVRATIGDKITVEDSVAYARSAELATAEKGAYTIGNTGNNTNEYFVNRMALTDKVTGEVLAVSTEPGMTDEKLAAERGIEAGSYDVSTHLSIGEDGNFIEANPTAVANDDLGWIDTEDGIYKDGTTLSEKLDLGRGVK